MRSNQGANFVGARNELKAAVTILDNERIRKNLLQENCDLIIFVVNLPASSHIGGVWEQQIRLVQNVPSPLLQSIGLQLDDESLRTLMCEVQATINNWPLSVDHLTDPSFLSPLAPNHLLTMKTKVILSPPRVFSSADNFFRKCWRHIQHLANELWTRWQREYLFSLQQHQKWTTSHRNLSEDDVIIIKDDSAACNH